MTDNFYFTPKKTEAIPSPQVEQVKQEPLVDIGSIPAVIRSQDTGDRVFLVVENTAHWIMSPQILNALGYEFGDVVSVERRVLNSLKIGENITMQMVDKYPKREKKIPVKEKKEEFKQYEPSPSPGAESAPKSEPEKGFTSIIIPAWFNNYPVFHYTGNCIGSIREHTDKKNTPYEIILIINGNTGIKVDNFQMTKADKVIQNEINKGFGFAVNQGIRCAKGEYIGILNNDIMVFDHWLEDLQEALQHLDLAMATPMYGKPFARAVEARELRELTLGKPIQETFSSFLDFSCVLTRKALFTELGTFDEQFFCYNEDVDLIYRMKQVEKTFASTKRVNTFHIIGATSSSEPATPEIMNESKRLFKEKWEKKNEV